MTDIVERLHEESALLKTCGKDASLEDTAAAEILRLRRESALLFENLDTLIIKLRSELEAAKKDAGRYRWARNSDWECFDGDWLRESGVMRQGRRYVDEESWNVMLDAAIDSEIAKG